MAKRTNKYQMVYFEQDDKTNALYEMQRWETLDAQLSALFEIMGNGVISGWNILELEDGGLSCTITAGSGHVNFIAVESSQNINIENLTTGTISTNTRNYIYAQLTNDSYWTKSVNFIASVYRLETVSEEVLYLGYVDTDENSIVSINTDDKEELGFISLINSAVSSHKHNGGENNPDPINLSSEVQGTISQDNLPELNANIIQAGTIDEERLPLIDHVTKLENQGTLTHAQLDSYLETLNIENQSLMGEVSTVNLLQLILALKHIYPDIDEYLVNMIAFIPGISPDDYIDTTNTTATVDTRTYAQGGQHTITGSSNETFKNYTKIWDTQDDFASGTRNNTIINSDTVVLDTYVTESIIDNFNNTNNWATTIEDLSSISSTFSTDSTIFITSPNSAKLTIGSNQVDLNLLLKKTFDAEDWSNYNYLTFYIYTTNVQHGDLYFYIKDANYGVQNSYSKVLSRNTPTINADTLINGWQEITFDLRNYERENITTIGFYVSTQEGWDTSKGFDFNIDNMKLTNGNSYYSDGYIRFIFGGDIPYDFDRLRWVANIPTDSLSSGVNLQARTRVANNTSDLSSATWSSYFSISGTSITLPTESLFKYIEVEIYFTAATSLKRSAILSKVYLDYSAADTEDNFEFTSKEDWETGSRFNIDTQTTDGSILISGVEDYNNYIYGTNSGLYQLNSSLEDRYGILGSNFPRSTNQILNDEQSSLGLITAVAKGNNGNIWFTDIDNNRVYEVDKSGNIIRGFEGSYISTPIDNYGTEDAGPGSNTNVLENSTETESSTELSLLHSLYNQEKGYLYVVFSKNLDNIYSTESTFDIGKFYIKVGSHKVWLNNSNTELLGLDETKYNNWYELSTNDDQNEYYQFINQFKFTSHILKITVTGSEKTLLDYMVNQKQPSIVIYSPKSQERLSGNVTARFVLFNFDLGTGTGENAIKVTLDGSIISTIYDTKITFTGLSSGVHTIKVELQNADSSLNTNIESIAESTFVIGSGSYSQPYLYINEPKPNQIYSSNPININYSIKNFPVLPTGQHVKYQIDSEAAIDYYSTNPITITDLDHGKHTIQIWTVDENGDQLSYTYGSVSVDFIIGLNSNASAKLYIEAEAISDFNGNKLANINNSYIDVENIQLLNIYSPIDIQMIPNETSTINNGEPTILISKLRSQTTLAGIGSSDNVAEIQNRINNSIEGATQIVLNSEFTGIDNNKLIYDSYYLDGHSVIQLDMDGNLIFSNNAAIFAPDIDTAKDVLGSAEKIGNTELLIGDSYSKRAIITNTNLTTQVPEIIWQYNSDRYIPDFHLKTQEEREISIYDGSISDSLFYIKQGQTIIFKNESSAPISIYSGSTTYETFYNNPNLNLYGEVFDSGVLEVGESYTFRFDSLGEYSWFVYPSILTGTISVTTQRLSSQDQYLILESDGLESPFSSRAIYVDSWGNVLWSFGEGYLVKPRDARPLLNNRVLIST